jgi:hypothetical protein
MPPRPRPILARIAHKIQTPPGMTEDMIVQAIAGWSGPAYDKPHWIWGDDTIRAGIPMVWNGTRPE